ncbi:MAG: MFS transporter [Actinobacteria bacterium]|nr:MFS transporter [Actinomycetota bacterium]NCV95495.1 MFS transporter [Actinomycetota bacterium]NCW46796.1 MFS transporter [Actinomycetota bacterium]NCW75200.1 MFS transporter [Actinomycetota bacterium]NCW93579.1 MFS transporter [Actinomycetota bacterium]
MNSPFKGLPREVSVLTTISFLVAIGFGLIIPAIPIFARTFGVTNTLIGLIISSFAIMRFLSGLFSGKLVDRFGERLVLGSGLLMVSVFTLLAGLAQSYGQLLFFRTAGGLGSSMFSVSAGALLLRVVGDDQRGRAQSLYNGGFIAGGVAGPAFGGALLAISPRAPFFIYTALLIVAGTVSLIFLHEKRLGSASKSVVSDGPALTIREALKIRPYLYSLFLAFLGSWIFFGMRSSILPLYAIDDLGVSTAVVGLSFTLALIAQGAVMVRAGKYSDKNGRRPVILVGFAITLVSLILLTLSTNVTFYLISMLVLGLGAGFATSAGAIVGDVIKGKSGKVYAFWQMAGDAGMMVGPLLLGVVADLFTYRTAVLVSALVFSLAILIAIRIPETNSARLGDSAKPQLRED